LRKIKFSSPAGKREIKHTRMVVAKMLSSGEKNKRKKEFQKKNHQNH